MLTSSTFGSASRNCVVHQGHGILKQCESTVGTPLGETLQSAMGPYSASFSLTAQLPSQDVSGDASPDTSLCCPDAIFVFSYTCFGCAMAIRRQILPQRYITCAKHA